MWPQCALLFVSRLTLLSSRLVHDVRGVIPIPDGHSSEGLHLSTLHSFMCDEYPVYECDMAFALICAIDSVLLLGYFRDDDG